MRMEDGGAGERRAVESVQLLTRLSLDDARAVVFDDRHDLYDGSSPSSTLRPELTLEDDVRTVIADHRREDTAAEADSVEALLCATVAPLSSNFRGRLKLRLPDGRLMHVWQHSWAVAEISSSADELEFWWTGLLADCPDPLFVAFTLRHIATQGRPEDGRRAPSVEGLHLRSCARCGGEVVFVVYGYPGDSTFALYQLGQVAIGGCVPPFSPRYACIRCREPAPGRASGPSPR